MFFITQDGESALMIAAREGMTEVVSLLQEDGANTDLQNEVKCRCDLKLSAHVFHHTGWRLCTDDGCQGG